MGPSPGTTMNFACTTQLPLVSRTDCTFGHSVRSSSGHRANGASSSSVKRASLVPDGPAGPAGPWGPADPAPLRAPGGCDRRGRPLDRLVLELRAAHSLGPDLRRADRVLGDLARGHAVARQRDGRRGGAPRATKRARVAVTLAYLGMGEETLDATGRLDAYAAGVGVIALPRARPAPTPRFFRAFFFRHTRWASRRRGGSAARSGEADAGAIRCCCLCCEMNGAASCKTRAGCSAG